MSTETLANDAASAAPWYDGMALKDRIKNLPAPMQVFVNAAFAGLLLLDLAVFDALPLLDEALLGWLLYVSVTASLESRRERRLPEPGRAVDVRGQQGVVEAGDYLFDAAEAEVEALSSSPFP